LARASSKEVQSLEKKVGKTKGSSLLFWFVVVRKCCTIMEKAILIPPIVQQSITLGSTKLGINIRV